MDNIINFKLKNLETKPSSTQLKNRKPSCWQLKEYGYRLESINLVAKKAHMYLNGSEKLLTLPIQDIVFNDYIINNSRALDSARIGYYYGILERKGEISKSTDMGTLQILKRGVLNIRSIDRDGKLMVEENNGQIVLSKKPIELYKNSQVLEQFPPTQALYIGYLASISSQHKGSEKTRQTSLLCISGMNES